MEAAHGPRRHPAIRHDLIPVRAAQRRLKPFAVPRSRRGKVLGRAVRVHPGRRSFRPRIRLGQGQALPPSFRTCVLQPAQGPAPWSAWTSGLLRSARG